MATDRQGYARAMRELRQADRELASDLRKAQWGTKRAVARVAAQMRRVDRQAGARLRTAWRRPPSGRIKLGLGRMPWPRIRMRGPHGGAKGPGGTAGRAPDTFHFNLSETRGGSVAVSHQRYIERDEACVESFGTLADEFEERCRLWDAIGQRTDKKEGCLIIEADAPEEVKRAVAARALAWGEEERISVRQAKATNRLQEKRWESGKPLRIKTFDNADHDGLTAWVRSLGGTPAEEDPDGEGRQHRKRLPKGVRQHAPRQGIVQRRVVLGIPHELSVAEMRTLVERWCEDNLGREGLRYHAVIHQPEGANDPRNWHAHIVYADIPFEREVDRNGIQTDRWTFERGKRLPEGLEAAQRLGGFGPEKRAGAKKMVWAWRKSWADLQNRALTAKGVDRRFDPRSYAAQGRDEIPGRHVGTKRAALESSGRGADAWSEEAPEWREVKRQLRAASEGDGMSAKESATLTEEVERLQVMAGLYSKGGQDPERSRAARAMQEEHEQHPLPVLKGKAGEWQARIRRLAGTTAGRHRMPAWAGTWRVAKRTVRHPVELEAVAARIAGAVPGGAEALAADARPEARQVMRPFPFESQRRSAPALSAAGAFDDGAASRPLVTTIAVDAHRDRLPSRARASRASTVSRYLRLTATTRSANQQRFIRGSHSPASFAHVCAPSAPCMPAATLSSAAKSAPARPRFRMASSPPPIRGRPPVAPVLRPDATGRRVRPLPLRQWRALPRSFPSQDSRHDGARSPWSNATFPSSTTRPGRSPDRAAPSARHARRGRHPRRSQLPCPGRLDLPVHVGHHPAAKQAATPSA